MSNFIIQCLANAVKCKDNSSGEGGRVQQISVINGNLYYKEEAYNRDVLDRGFTACLTNYQDNMC